MLSFDLTLSSHEEEQEERFSRRLATLLMFLDCCAFCEQHADYECDLCHRYTCADDILVFPFSERMICRKCDGESNKTVSYLYRA